MKRIILILAPYALLLSMGCGSQGESESPSVSTIDGTPYLLTDEPADAQDVIAARSSTQNQQTVAVVGRIGGSANPWVKGRAAFSIVDSSLKACSDIPGDKCKAPWDYCCETDTLVKATALVKVVDAQGRLLQADARQLLNLSELQTVVVRGTAQRDDAGNLTLLATGIFVRQ
ncbi:MAG: hypothetical protein VX346_23750 [Planctomycetota bacterium]|nr:hypothetical protein [Planctomycetota bacterium]